MTGGRWIISGSDRTNLRKYILLSESEKQRMFKLPRKIEEYNKFWYDQLIAAGCVVNRVVSSIQLKDMAGNWMNIFQVNYK